MINNDEGWRFSRRFVWGEIVLLNYIYIYIFLLHSSNFIFFQNDQKRSSELKKRNQKLSLLYLILRLSSRSNKQSTIYYFLMFIKLMIIFFSSRMPKSFSLASFFFVYSQIINASIICQDFFIFYYLFPVFFVLFV